MITILSFLPIVFLIINGSHTLDSQTSQYPDIGIISHRTIVLDHYTKPEIKIFNSKIVGIMTDNDPQTTLTLESGDKLTIPNSYIHFNIKYGDILKIREIHAIPICKATNLIFHDFNFLTYHRSITQVNFTQSSFSYYSSQSFSSPKTLSAWLEQAFSENEYTFSTINGAADIQKNPNAQSDALESLSISPRCSEKTFWDIDKL